MIDFPSDIKFYKNGNIYELSWYKNRLLHRDNDLPAYIEYFDNGEVSSKSWFQNGEPYRKDNLPTEIIFYKNNQIMHTRRLEGYEPNSKNFTYYYRQKFNRNGKLNYEEHIKNKKYHRLFGPALISKTINGYTENWYINGKIINDEVDNFIKEYNLPNWQEWNDDHKILFKLKFL